MSKTFLDGLQIHYEFLPALKKEHHGNLILLHTIGLNLNEFDCLIPYFRQDYNILRYDLFGHGKSEIPHEPITFQLLLDQLVFMSNHFFNENFYIIANPVSGYVASRFCRHYEDRVSGLILISPPPTYLPLPTRKDIVKQIVDRASISFDDFKQQFIVANLTVKKDENTISTLKTQLDQTTERVYFECMNAYLTENLNDDFSCINTPILLLSGDQDTLFPATIHGITANFIGASAFHMIPEASTLVAFDNPSWTSTMILRFFHKKAGVEEGKSAFLFNREEIVSALKHGFGSADQNRTLSVKLLNTFQVLNGEIEMTKGWNLRKAKSLFLYLLFHKTATREELINSFWPDLEMNKARNHLRVCLNHLKSLLKREDGIHFLHIDRNQVFLHGDIQCDAFAYIKGLEEANNESNPKIKLILGKQILQVSAQKLLTQLYDDWFLEIRDAIETKYSELCKFVAAELRSSGKFEEALKFERMGVRTTPALE